MIKFFLSSFFYFFISFSVLAQKTDKLLLNNNDWITGEIKKLDYAKLSLKTSSAGTIQIKWDHIYQIKSDKYFEISLGKGVKYYGSLDITETDEKYKVLVIMEEEQVEVDMNRIVEITPIKNKFWTRIDGNLDIGYSYTKASDVSSWNASTNVYYRQTKSLTSITASSIFTEQPERDPTSKQDFGLSYKHYMSNNWAYTGFGALQQNTELGINLRTSIGLGISKNWFTSNSQRLISTVGPIINQENGSDEGEKQINYEAVIRLEYRIFRYNDPEVNITAYFDFYPSFTIKDRYRTDLNINFKYEIFNNFYIGFTFYHNLDTKPPESAVSSSDWGVTTSIGYTF